VIAALTEVLPAGARLDALFLETLAEQLVSDPDAIRLLASSDPLTGPKFSTYNLLDVELLALERGQSSGSVTVDEAVVTTALADRRLSPDQERAVRALLSSSRTVEVVLGPAGSGKTSALAAAHRGWTASGTTVVGAALAAVTARRLEAATGIRSSSLARLIDDLEQVDPATGRPAGLPPGGVIVIDEASMVGTRQLGILIDHVNAANGKLVLVGDLAQLPEVEAGGLFAVLPTQHRPIMLTGNQRQRNEWERAALERLRSGDIDVALDAYLAHDRVHLDLDADAIGPRIAEDYVRARQTAGPYDVIVLASRRSDVERINEQIRGRLRDAGALGPDVPIGSDGDASYAVGDLVQVTRNDYRRGLYNGTRASVTAANNKEVTLQTEAGATLAVPSGWAARRLTHAYAMTVHKAQGLTVDTCLLYGTGALCQQAGYVGMSRGREANHLYTSLTAFEPEDAGVAVGVPKRFELLTGGPDPAEVLDALAARLADRREHVLASQQRPVLDRRLRRGLDPPAPDRAAGLGR
jgi:ATP-dependent exoDNAse (exonuclease V) alpha subunit